MMTVCMAPRINLAAGIIQRVRMTVRLCVSIVLVLGVTPPSLAGFVRLAGRQLVLDGSPFYFVGMNSYWMPSTAAFGDTGSVDKVMARAQVCWGTTPQASILAKTARDALVRQHVAAEPQLKWLRAQEPPCPWDGETCGWAARGGHLEALGIRVVRTWAFNDELPASPGVYNEAQFKGLDWVVKVARERNIKLVLALGNFWNAYAGPEKFLAMAEGSAAGKDIASFYASQSTKDLFKRHISSVVSRINTYTGVAYKDDDAIMAWNLLNEPRCPACDSSQASAHLGWLTEMAAHLKAAAPSQLISSSTEGFFDQGSSYVSHNPGAGGTCEGEDFIKVNSISNMEVATTHMYERHYEMMQQLGWRKPSIPEYINALAGKIGVYTDAASSIGRPLVVEEFGLTRRFAGEQERNVVFAVMLGSLVAAKRAGRPFMGAMFWNGVLSGSPDVGGYSVHVDRSGKGGFSLPAGVVGGSGAAAASPAVQYGRRRQLLDPLSGAHNRSLAQIVVNPGEDTLDSFRRGPQRQACASAAAALWSGSMPVGLVDVSHYMNLVSAFDIVDIIQAAASQLA